MMRSRYLNARTQQTREQLARFVPKVAQKAAGWAQLRESCVSADEVMERYLTILEMVLGRATYIAQMIELAIGSASSIICATLTTARCFSCSQPIWKAVLRWSVSQTIFRRWPMPCLRW